MRPAASSGSSCSQTRTTVQPAASRDSWLRASRARLRASFAVQYSEFERGRTPCSEQPCQKHPSTKTATRARGNATSGRGAERPAPSFRSTRNRSPRRWSADRRARSGVVSLRRFARMTARTAGLEAGGGVGSLTQEQVWRGDSTLAAVSAVGGVGNLVDTVSCFTKSRSRPSHVREEWVRSVAGRVEGRVHHRDHVALNLPGPCI